jgi:hypothetical protein
MGHRFEDACGSSFEHGHGDTFMMLPWVPLVRERVSHSGPDQIGAKASDVPGDKRTSASKRRLSGQGT